MAGRFGFVGKDWVGKIGRKMKDGERAALALKGAEGKRLTYRQPREAANA
jgi:hypothetical protein